MSWHVNQLKYALGLGGIMSFYGAVSLIIMLLPPGTFGNRQYQIVTVLLVLLTLPFALVIMFVASRRAKRAEKLKEEEAKQAAEAATPVGAQPTAAPGPAPAGSYANLTSSTEETVQFLKTSNLGSSGRDAVYSLPWYLVAGAPRAGKSSLVLGSNLNFQTLPSQRQSEQKFIRPTGSVDWRVTSDAVFVDTAGRYQTEGVDAEEWASLLETIKKYRGNRPIDGFLLVVDTEMVLKADERKMEELAKVLRARLDETMQRLKVRFPVYVVFTHADAIEGFRDSFSASKGEDKTLVWGATIPIEKSDNAQALFDSEYEILHNSLMKRRIVRLSAPFPPVRQLRIFNFPLHFGSARRKFGAFINSLFRPNPFSENPFLRGFYFTAAPVGKTSGGAPPTVGNPYFTERFFRDVVLRDKDLVKTAQDARKRPPILGWTLTTLGALAVLFFLVMSAVSLVKNQELRARAEERGLAMKQLITASKDINPLDKMPDAVKAELDETERMREFLAVLDTYDVEGPPLTHRFGLYSGTRLFKESLLPMYLGVVEQRFKAPAMARLEADLKKFSESKPVANPANLTPEEVARLEGNFKRLKVYLMLTGKHRDKAQSAEIVEVLKQYWLEGSKTPPDRAPVAEQQLAFWAKQAWRGEEVKFEGIPLNEDLVKAVRTKLKDYPAEYRYLSRKVSEISGKIGDGYVTADQILSRNSSSGTNYVSGTYQIPTAYTREGLDQMKPEIENAAEEMKKDDWIMGDEGRAAGGVDIKRIEDRYYNDYALHWQKLVQTTRVSEFKNLDQTNDALQEFSRPDSALIVLVREVVKNTDFSIEPEQTGLWPWIKSWFVSKKDKKEGTSEPEKAFRPVFKFVGKKDDAEPPVDKYRNVFKNLQEDLVKEGGRGMADLIAKASSDKKPLQIDQRENFIKRLTADFKETPSAQDVEILLLKPVQNLRTLLGIGEKDQLIKHWNEQILTAAKEMEKGYPFTPGGGDADMKAINDLLAPNEGKLSVLVKERLSAYIEDGGNGVYRNRPDSKMPLTDEALAYLTNAFALQKALYGTSPTPNFEYEFVLQPMKDPIVEVTIDGKQATTQGTGSINGKFPGSTDTGVLMKVASTSGPISAPTSANPSNSNVSTPGGGTPESSSGEIKEPGQWGLFKFVDKGAPQKQENGSYLLKYNIAGKTVTATVRASGGDLFNKEMFQRVKAPQAIVK